MAVLRRTVADLLKATLFLSAVCSCQSAQPLTLSIQEGSQTVDLSFESSEANAPLVVRAIQVAPGFTYKFQCARVGGLDGNSQIWYRGDVLVSLNTSERIYARMPNSNSWILEVTSFSSGDGGMYSCRSSEEMLGLDISSGNPAVIPGTPYLTRNGGSQGSNRPSLRPFVSGSPSFPTAEQGAWTFVGRDGGTVLPPRTGFVPGERELLLSPELTNEHSGTYNYTVTTTAGTATAQFEVTVIIAPAVLISPGLDQVVVVGQTLNITCSDSTGIPPPSFTWKLDDEQLSSGGQVTITDSSDSILVTSRLTLHAISLGSAGNYECLARNNPDPNRYGGQDIMVSVLLPSMPPQDIAVVSTTPCTVSISWTSPLPNNSAPTDIYIIEIQLSSNGSRESWAELGRGPSPLLQVTIPPRGFNTTYFIRGRGYSNVYGDGTNSEAYGEFISYESTLSSSIGDLVASPTGMDSIGFTWSLEGGSCYKYNSIAVSCEQETNAGTAPVVASPPGGVGTSSQVTGLEADTRYSCTVSGVFTESGGTGRIQEMSQATVSTFTFPTVPPQPSVPKLDDTTITIDRFTVTFEPLPSNLNISHYHIIVLRLSGLADLPTQAPDSLYPTSARFSTCRLVNVPTDEAITYQPYIAAEISAADFSLKFVVGGGEEADTVLCNEKLVPGASYTVFLRAYPVCVSCQAEEGAAGGMDGRRRKRQALMKQYTVFRSSGFLLAVTTGVVEPTRGPGNPSGSDVTIIVVCVLVVGSFLLILFAVLSVFYCYYRRTRLKSLTFSPSIDHSFAASSDSDLACYPDTPDLGGKRKNGGIELKAMEAFADPLEMQFQPSGPVRKEDFAKHVERFDAKRQLLFTEEFDWIGKKSPWHSAKASNHPANDSKNRYSNITAFDHSAVKLKPLPGKEHSDYINANFISGYSKAREYIATQGPLDQTVEDFWRMVWEQNTTTIIMLTNLVELGKIKCAQYWPSSSKTMYGDIAVTLEHTHLFPDYTIRTLGVQLSKTNEQRRVLQFHYTKWPDYGTPKLAAPLLNFLKIVHESIDIEEKAGPMVVHCSAGVGRSGTVLTIDYALQQLRSDGVADVCQFVCNMREQRSYMVQTDQQYTFIYYAILEAITYGDTSYDVEGFLNSYSKLQSSSSPASSPGKLVLGEEFERLGVVKTMVKKSSFQNRIKVKGAPQRHFHSSFHGGSATGSLQQCLGHFLDGYNQSSLFLLTEGPEEMGAMRFWELVWDYNCSSIIMLTPLDTEEMFCYWPDSGSVELQFGSIKVMVESESAEHLYTCRRIILANTKVEGISHQLVQYQFMGWTTQYLPRVPDFVSFVCDVLQKVDLPKATSPLDRTSKVMVHDTSSLGPAGIFCSLFYTIQRLQTEKMVDIFQTVQMIQLQRPGCVTTMEEYAFIYDCVYEFLMKNS